MDQRGGQLFRQAPEHLFLHHRLAEAHVDAAFDLAQCQHRVDGLTDVVGHPDVLAVVNACLRVHFHLDHGGGIGIGRRRSHAGASVSPRRAGRNVRPGGAQGAVAGLGGHHGRIEVESVVRVAGGKYASICEHQFRLGDLQLRRDCPGNDVAGALRGLHGGMAHHHGDP